MALSWSKLGLYSVRLTCTLNENPPTAPEEGIPLADCEAITPIVFAPTGQTFTGGANSGVFAAYFYHPDAGLWIPGKRFNDAPDDLAGEAYETLPSVPIYRSVGMFALIPQNILTSGGTTMIIDLIASPRRYR